MASLHTTNLINTVSLVIYMQGTSLALGLSQIYYQPKQSGTRPHILCGKGSTEQGKTSSHQIPYSYLNDGAERKEWEVNNFPEHNVPGLHNWSYHVRNNYKMIKNSLTRMKSPAFFNSKSWHLRKNSRGFGQERRSNNTIKDKTFPFQLKTRTEQKLKSRSTLGLWPLKLCTA